MYAFQFNNCGHAVQDTFFFAALRNVKHNAHNTDQSEFFDIGVAFSGITSICMLNTTTTV